MSDHVRHAVDVDRKRVIRGADGMTRKVDLRLAHSSAAALRSSHQVIVETVEQGVSLKGPRHALRLISVRRSQSRAFWWLGAIGAAALVLVTGVTATQMTPSGTTG